MRHIVWDWNGTLLDDLGTVVAAVNDTLATLGRRPICVEEYGANYTRPVRRTNGCSADRSRTSSGAVSMKRSTTRTALAEPPWPPTLSFPAGG